MIWAATTDHLRVETGTTITFIAPAEAGGSAEIAADLKFHLKMPSDQRTGGTIERDSTGLLVSMDNGERWRITRSTFADYQPEPTSDNGQNWTVRERA